MLSQEQAKNQVEKAATMPEFEQRLQEGRAGRSAGAAAATGNRVALARVGVRLRLKVSKHCGIRVNRGNVSMRDGGRGWGLVDLTF